MPPDELEQLRQAAQDLEYPSESDAPFEPFSWPGTPGDSAAAQVGSRCASGQNIEEVSVAQFFADLDNSEDVDRFRRLRSELERILADLRIFRVGVDAATVDIYLIGRSPSGDWAGLRTTSVET